MKTIQTVQGLCLLAILTGPWQVLCLQEVPLTMFNNSVDDQYINCSLTRESKLQDSGNIPLDKNYSDTWKKAKSHWNHLGQTVGSFNPIYGTAIAAYTIESSLYSNFNAAAREAGKSQDSYDHYAFKDFHFLLTKALQAKKIKGRCYKVFRGIRKVRFTISGNVVRFGQFASSSLDENVAKAFGEGTLFSIKTCHGASIDVFSYMAGEKEVLIPPYEMFTVTDHRRTQNGVFIKLESRGVFSRFNCEVLNAAGLLTPLGMPFLLWGLLLTWSTLGSLGSL